MDKEDKPEDKKFHCETCKKTYSNISALNKHFKTASHLQNELKKEDNEKTLEIKSAKGKTKIENEFYCPLCDYEIERRDYFIKHLNSKKHEQNYDEYEKSIEKSDNKEELLDLLADLEHGDIKIGIVKDNLGFKEITKTDILDLFRIDEYINLKPSLYPKTIKQSKHIEGEKTIKQTKEAKNKEKIEDLEYQIKIQSLEIKKIEKERKLFLETKDANIPNRLRQLNVLEDNIKKLKNKLEKLKN